MERDKKRLSLLCKVVVVPFLILAYVKAIGIDDFFSDLTEQDCSDPDTNATIFKLSNGIQSVVEKNKSALIMTALIVMLEVV